MAPIPCVYHRGGHCSKGQYCPFSHDVSINTKHSKSPCKVYFGENAGGKRGQCRYGSNCAFSHSSSLNSKKNNVTGSGIMSKIGRKEKIANEKSNNDDRPGDITTTKNNEGMNSSTPELYLSVQQAPFLKCEDIKDQVISTADTMAIPGFSANLNSNSKLALFSTPSSLGSLWGFDDNDDNTSNFGTTAGSTYFYGAAGVLQSNSSEEYNFSIGFNTTANSTKIDKVYQTNIQDNKKKTNGFSYASVARAGRNSEDEEIERLEEENIIKKLVLDEQAQVEELRKQKINQKALPICDFFRLGSCKYQESCRFRHDFDNDNENVLYEAGGAGVDDKNYQEFGSDLIIENHQEEMGEMYSINNYHKKIKRIDTDGGTQNSEIKLKQEQDDPRLIPPTSYNATTKKKKFDEKVGEENEERECGICFGRPTNSLYGVLSHCNCIFCLSCIREWRRDGATVHNQGMANETLRKCPLCRKESYYTVPSSRTFSLGSALSESTEKIFTQPQLQRLENINIEKEAFITAYKLNLQSKICRIYSSKGECPFGTSCFYRHVNAEGQEEINDDKSNRRYLLGSDGETQVSNKNANISLAHFRLR